MGNFKPFGGPNKLNQMKVCPSTRNFIGYAAPPVACGCVICIFCNFGPLYLVKVCPNAALVEPGFYAPVKYFSAAQASKAQRATHGRGFLQSSPLKLYILQSVLQVKLSTKQYPNFLHNSKPLSHSKCQDFANHFMGFNGCSDRVVQDILDVQNSLEGKAAAPW
ncbi:RAD52 motif-containing protein 1-like [Oncorhynchus kisutch]|uniref:RAD52 motif-containing protein 1-like n=1 Tax=Oncorhynchus kisutch TaxID=8019 RepID=UPI0012DD8F8F|nr:RAD52 motif-containing protein 1-like [Oncorhynchus kisutch]